MLLKNLLKELYHFILPPKLWTPCESGSGGPRGTCIRNPSEQGEILRVALARQTDSLCTKLPAHAA